MTRIKRLNTLLFILIAVVSCGKPSPGYDIYRFNDALLVFIKMDDSSEIVDATLDDQNLKVNIASDEEIFEQVISLQKKFLISLVEHDETVAIEGTSRINQYGVVHLKVSSPVPRKISMSITWTGWNGKNSIREGSHSNTGTFRIDDKLIACTLLPDFNKSSWEVSNFGINIKYETKTSVDNVVNDDVSRRLLNIEVDDPDIPVHNLSFPLTDLTADENVVVKEKKKVGNHLYIIHMNIIPMLDDQTTVESDDRHPFDNSSIVDR